MIVPVLLLHEELQETKNSSDIAYTDIGVNTIPGGRHASHAQECLLLQHPVLNIDAQQCSITLLGWN